MKIVFTLLFFCVIGPLHACVCFDIDSAFAKKLMDEVEFVIIGHAVKNVGFNEKANGMWDQSNKGVDVLFEVDSVLKGDLPSKTLLLKQFGDNCDRAFVFGERYIIVGNELQRFVNITPRRRKTKKGEIPDIPEAPPPPSVYSKTAIFWDSCREEVDFWNDLAKDNFVLNTSSCSSFFLDSRIASYFLSN